MVFFVLFFKLMVLDESLEPEKCVGRCCVDVVLRAYLGALDVQQSEMV